MKKIIIDEYELYLEDGCLKKIVFKDYLGNKVTQEINNEIEEVFQDMKRMAWKEERSDNRHIDNYLKEDSLFEIKTSKYEKSPEQIIVEKEALEKIIREIWRLRIPQNRRVYMYLVDGLTYSKIARIEKRDFMVIKRSIKAGIRNLEKKIKKILIY